MDVDEERVRRGNLFNERNVITSTLDRLRARGKLDRRRRLRTT